MTDANRTQRRQIAKRILPLLDLTRLEAGDEAAAIEAFCRRALTPAGEVAAVCLLPQFVPLARACLAGTAIRVATVANFPEGSGGAERVLLDIGDAVLAGADEVELVLPYRGYVEGKTEAQRAATALVAAAKAACGERPLKVILETGALAAPELITLAGRDAIAAGADFLKTSTGRRQPGATPEAARLLLELCREVRERGGRPVGFKAAGGIRSLADAARYLALADAIMGPGWASPASFRIGASALLDDILAALARDAEA